MSKKQCTQCNEPLHTQISEELEAEDALRHEYDNKSKLKLELWATLFRPFCIKMQERFEEKQPIQGWGDSWKELEAYELSDRLYACYNDLDDAIANGKKALISKKCADLANFAAMIEERFGERS